MNDDLFKYANDLADSMSAAAENTPSPQKNVFTVTELSTQVRRLIEGRFATVAVEGEISGLKVAASGHAYLKLKDDDSAIDAVIWRGSLQKMDLQPEDGQHVVAYGKLTTYGARSTYQLVIERLELAGLGALMQRFEALKKKLGAEGLFDPARKKPIPLIPHKIGIITSPTGAVIRDMLVRLEGRFGRPVLLWPVLVQGVGAKEQIAQAIEGMNKLPDHQRPDVLIVARGGGSLEDLWAFNEEIVVRAVANSTIPVISGVGHEPDVTLCDLAADLRAPTPTAAAVEVVPDRQELQSQVLGYKAYMAQNMVRQVRHQRERVIALGRLLPRPQNLLDQARLKLDDRTHRLRQALRAPLVEKRHKLAALSATLSPQTAQRYLDKHTQELARLKPKLARIEPYLAQRRERVSSMARWLQSLSPHAPLSRGYAYVTDNTGQVVTTAATSAKQVVLHFADGKRGAVLDDKKPS